MNSKEKEILLITMEECAEVTQAISKIFRFGIDDTYNDISNREQLTTELGDLKCMIELIMLSGMVNRSEVCLAEIKKKEKLTKWSNIFGA
jgi:NTP pyrophosphatase (non-canonical NTP hydrolase)